MQMSNHLFRPAEANASVGEFKEPIAHPTFSQAFVDGTDPTSYKAPNFANGYTELPISKPTGALLNGDIYAGVKPGKVYKLDPDVGDFVAVAEHPLVIPNAVATKDTSQPVVKKRGNKRDKALNEIIETATVKASEELMSTQKELPTVKIALSGAFGKFTGTYVSIVKEGNLVILIQKLSDDGFVPPISEENPVKITVNSATASADYDTYYLGMTFALPVFECRIFVYHIPE
jgi:hypothetical protein